MKLSVNERLKLDLEVFRRLLDNFGAALRVSAPGIIQSFDAATQTVTVKLAIREKIAGVNVEPDDVEIPILVDVPIVIPRAGGFSLTLPVQAGDECLVVFGDNCMDAWYQSGGVQNQIDRRRHDLSDGFAILGVGSQPEVISGYSTSNAELRNSDGTVKVIVKSDRVTIDANIVELSNGTLKKLINEEFVTKFNQHTHPTAGTGSPSTPTVPVVLADVATSKTKAG